jgi:hypothetical protein
MRSNSENIMDMNIHLLMLRTESKGSIVVRKCQARVYSLDKEQTSYDDLLDALRLSLKGYQIE